MQHAVVAVHTADVVGPAVAAGLVVFMLSRIGEPTRLKILALFTAGFSTAYLGGGLGPLELLYVVPATYVAYRALSSYWFVGIGWLMHAPWDLVHHVYGQPIWPWVPTSAIGCAIFDPIVALWVFSIAGKTSISRQQRGQTVHGSAHFGELESDAGGAGPT